MQTLTAIIHRNDSEYRLTRRADAKMPHIVEAEITNAAGTRRMEMFLAQHNGQDVLKFNGAAGGLLVKEDLAEFIAQIKADLAAEKLCNEIQSRLAVSRKRAVEIAQIVQTSRERVHLMQRTQLLREGDYEQMADICYYAEGGELHSAIVSEHH